MNNNIPPSSQGFSLSNIHNQAFEVTTRFIRHQKDNLLSHNLKLERKMLQLEVDKEHRNVQENYNALVQDSMTDDDGPTLVQYPMPYKDFARMRLNRFFGHINNFVNENTPGYEEQDFDAGHMCHTQ
jgi:hypothetical protein